MTLSTFSTLPALLAGLVFVFSLSAHAKTSTHVPNLAAQQWFEKGRKLVKQNKQEQGVRLLEKAALKGHAQAAFELASLHEVGLVVEKDFRLARKYYEAAIKLGYRDAHFNMALLLSSPLTPNHDLKRARELVLVVADQGDVEAQFLLARLMKTKLYNVSARPRKAFYWLQHAANSGHGKAQFQLGTQYLTSEHVSKNLKSALRWFNRAAMQNIPEAHYNLALMYEKGNGVVADISKAITWYESAAELGSVRAQQNLGIKYLTGDSLTPKPRRAIQLLTSAARAGSEDSQLLLGKLYQFGFKGRIKIDLAKAEIWYLRAARQGKSEAQYQLALMLFDKKNGEDEAKLWMRRAVAAGHVEATLLEANL